MNYEAENFVRFRSPWLVCGVVLVGLLLAAELGYRVAMRHRAASARGEDTGGLGIILGALLGLLSLLLSFTYSYVVIRNESRRTAIITEANAIGTAYLRTSLVPAPAGPELQRALRDYLDTRILPDEVGESPERLRQAIEHSEEVQARLWPLVQRALAGRTPNPLDALLIESINDVIDLDTIRLAAGRDHVPSLALWMLFFLSLVALSLCGFMAGAAGARRFGRNAAVAVVIVVVTYIILDLDHPRGGLIRVSQQSLEDLRAGLDRPPTAMTTPPATGSSSP